MTTVTYYLHNNSAYISIRWSICYLFYSNQ